MHASDNVCVCLKKKCQQTAFITPTPSSFTPPPPWNYEATNRATSPNPPNSRTSAGELYFNLIWHVSGTAKNRGKNLVQRGFDLKKQANILLSLFWDISFDFNFYTFSHESSVSGRKTSQICNAQCVCGANVSLCVSICVCVCWVSDKTGLLKCGRHCRFLLAGWQRRAGAKPRRRKRLKDA